MPQKTEACKRRLDAIYYHSENWGWCSMIAISWLLKSIKLQIKNKFKININPSMKCRIPPSSKRLCFQYSFFSIDFCQHSLQFTQGSALAYRLKKKNKSTINKFVLYATQKAAKIVQVFVLIRQSNIQYMINLYRNISRQSINILCSTRPHKQFCFGLPYNPNNSSPKSFYIELWI